MALSRSCRKRLRFLFLWSIGSLFNQFVTDTLRALRRKYCHVRLYTISSQQTIESCKPRGGDGKSISHWLPLTSFERIILREKERRQKKISVHCFLIIEVSDKEQERTVQLSMLICDLHNYHKFWTRKLASTLWAPFRWKSTVDRGSLRTINHQFRYWKTLCRCGHEMDSPTKNNNNKTNCAVLCI